ncbi:MAG TPA: protein phosphatase 2C domain-containing protein [Caulobacteraceae bacterium]|jgi:serine/threonine protein phosphatase PrpC|nr:protein phosphatase 2C domain-containing protein [Caulobacteraceae bacterium]
MGERAFRFIDSAVTDVGRVRTVNEDSFVAAAQSGLWAVADGMGGHENGQKASRTVAEQLSSVEFQDDFDADSMTIADAVHAANAAIWSEASAAGKQMGSTAAALFVNGHRFAVVWAGDSRVYLLREGSLHRLTRDHTQVQEMVDRGYLTEAEAKNHPMSHVISRAVGVGPELELEAVADQVIGGDVFLLCSDGLYNMVSDEEIAHQLAQASPHGASKALVDAALERGAPDNVTVIAVACEPVTLLTIPAASTES